MIPILETKFNRRSKISAWTVILFLSMGWVSPSLFSSEIFPLGILGAKGEAKDDCHWILIQKEYIRCGVQSSSPPASLSRARLLAPHFFLFL